MRPITAYRPIIIALTLVGLVSLSTPPLTVLSDVKNQTGLKVAGHRVLAVHQTAETRRVFEVMLEDSSGHLWLNSMGGLMSAEDGNINRLRLFPMLTVTTNPLMLETKDGRVWLSYLWRDQQLSFFDGSSWRNLDETVCPRGFSPGELSKAKVFAGSAGRIWFLVRDRLVAYDGVKWSSSVAVPSDPDGSLAVRAMLQDGAGMIWVETAHSIKRFDETGRSWITNSKPNGFKGGSYIQEDRSGRIWFVSTFGGVSIYDKAADDWTHHDVVRDIEEHGTDSSCGSSRAFLGPIYQDKFNQILVASSHGLLVYRDALQNCRLQTSRDSALPGDCVSGIFEDRQGRIWITTENGIAVLEG